MKSLKGQILERPSGLISALIFILFSTLKDYKIKNLFLKGQSDIHSQYCILQYLIVFLNLLLNFALQMNLDEFLFSAWGNALSEEM